MWINLVDYWVSLPINNSRSAIVSILPLRVVQWRMPVSFSFSLSPLTHFSARPRVTQKSLSRRERGLRGLAGWLLGRVTKVVHPSSLDISRQQPSWTGKGGGDLKFSKKDNKDCPDLPQRRVVYPVRVCQSNSHILGLETSYDPTYKKNPFVYKICTSNTDLPFSAPSVVRLADHVARMKREEWHDDM